MQAGMMKINGKLPAPIECNSPTSTLSLLLQIAVISAASMRPSLGSKHFSNVALLRVFTPLINERIKVPEWHWLAAIYYHQLVPHEIRDLLNLTALVLLALKVGGECWPTSSFYSIESWASSEITKSPWTHFLRRCEFQAGQWRAKGSTSRCQGRLHNIYQGPWGPLLHGKPKVNIVRHFWIIRPWHYLVLYTLKHLLHTKFQQPASKHGNAHEPVSSAQPASPSYIQSPSCRLLGRPICGFIEQRCIASMWSRDL